MVKLQKGVKSFAPPGPENIDYLNAWVNFIVNSGQLLWYLWLQKIIYPSCRSC